VTNGLLCAEQKSSGAAAGYLPVQVEMLRRLRQAPVDLFIQNESSGQLVLYCRNGCALDPARIARLTDEGIRQIYVLTSEFNQFAAHLLAAIDAHSELEAVPAAERYAALQLAMAVEIEHATRLIDCGPYVAAAEKLGRDLTSLLAGSNVLPRDLYQLARHDFSTFAHITNVASYALILSERLGLCRDSELESLAKAAILHDIGKRFIPASILSKPARLDAAERSIIETHPQRGYEELCARNDMSEGQLMVVYQHHEKYDGSGYPVGFQGDEIHPWARMLAIVDVFDAMTGTRPYRRPCTAQEAMEYICKNAGNHFDPEMVECWKSTMAKT
jgi:HD-GYP domain-containing protein (c-di-GMP phosphodiesterase class II)